MRDMSVKRAVMLLGLDLARAARTSFPVVMTFWLAFILICLIADLVFGVSIKPEDRNVMIFFMSFLFAAYLPSGVFSHIRKHRNEVIHILLPVNRNLKFLSMIAVGSLVLPVSFMAGLYLLDGVMVSSGSGGGLPAMPSVGQLCSDFMDIMMVQSVFVLCNIIFRKHKSVYSVLCMTVLWGPVLLLADMTAVRAVVAMGLYVLAYDRFRNMEL